MKKILFLSLTAIAMLISGNAKAAIASVTDLQNAINDAPRGAATATVITLDQSIDFGASNIAIFDRNIELVIPEGMNITSSGTTIYFLKGTLNISGKGSIISSSTADAIRVMGSANPEAANYTNLTVGKDITVIGGKGIQIYTLGCGYKYEEGAYASIKAYDNNVLQPSAGADHITGKMNLKEEEITELKNSANKLQSVCFKSGSHGYAFGVNVDIYGKVSGREYALQVSGTVRGCRTMANGTAPFTGATTAKWPMIIVEEGAVLTGISNGGNMYPKEGESYPTGIYAAGYADWVIKGKVTGDNGIIAKSGKVTVDESAEISATGNYVQPTSAGSGTKSSGNAIDLTSDDAYSGRIEVSVSGGASVSSEKGYALIEEVAIGATTSTKTADVTITGGNFQGGEGKAAVKTTSEVKQQIVTKGTITGGTFSDNEIKEYLPAVSGLITIEVNENNEPVYVIGGTKDPVQWKNEDINTVADGAYVEYKGSDVNYTLTKDVNIAYLSMADKENDATITIPAGKTLKVGEIVMGENAQIVVEAGGKLVVNGENGIIAFEVFNLVIKADATNGMGTFVLNPAVKGNKTPWATVEYMCSPLAGKFTIASKTAYYWDIISSPFAEMISITTPDQSSYYQRVVDQAYVNVTDKQQIYDNVKAFDALAICPNADRGSIKYIMTGKLQGATSLADYAVVSGFNHMGNAYMAKMNAKELVTELQQNNGSIRTLIYIWSVESQKYIGYNGYLLQLLGNIDPMKSAFLYSDGEGTANLNYEKLIWNVNK
ncbi:MAG: hypothetical protein MJZ64_04745 [Paludibacteraceae bacterium]|nr:hypothetical protein [Paludibacteraceae bacterium]